MQLENQYKGVGGWVTRILQLEDQANFVNYCLRMNVQRFAKIGVWLK